MAINSTDYSKIGSPLAGIVNALQAVGSYYGIKEASLKAEQLQNALDNQKEGLKPDSKSSEMARQAGLAGIDMLEKTGEMPRATAESLRSSINPRSEIKGTPAQRLEGPATESGQVPMTPAILGIPAKPGASKAEVDSLLKEEGPIISLAKANMMAKAQAAKLAGITSTKQDANLMRANSAYDNIIGKNYENRLDAADRVKKLIQSSLDGTLIPSENLGQQLASDINILQSNKSTVSGTEHARPNTLFGKSGQLFHFLSGDPQAAITKSDLNQMLIETNTLYNEIGNQHRAKFNSWIKGQPQDLRGPLNDRFNESRSQYSLDQQPARGGSPFPGSTAQAAAPTSNLAVNAAAKAEMERRAGKK